MHTSSLVCKVCSKFQPLSGKPSKNLAIQHVSSRSSLYQAHNTEVLALKIHSTTPVEPESARQLGGNSGGPPCSHGADARGGSASPFVPHDAVTTPGVDPTVRTRSPAGPRGRHVTPPAAAQRPAGPRSVGATSVWRGEPRTKSIGSASGCREGELVGPEASASTTSTRLGELVRARSDRSPRRPLDLKTRPGPGAAGARDVHLT